MTWAKWIRQAALVATALAGLIEAIASLRERERPAADEPIAWPGARSAPDWWPR